MNAYYIDTNFLVNLFIDPEESKKIIDSIRNGEVYTSSLTYDELIWAIRKLLGKESSKLVGDFFLNLNFLKILDINRETLTISNEEMKRFDLKPRDSLHYASMKQNKINKIVTKNQLIEPFF
jgi:predicted nucleic acid-binding protein